MASASIQRIEDVFREPEQLLIARQVAWECDHRGYDRVVDVTPDEVNPHAFQCRSRSNVLTGLMRLANMSGTDLTGTGSLCEFVRKPRMVRPTDEQHEALEHVSLHITGGDFTSPFPCLLVETHKNPMFKAVVINTTNPGVTITTCIARSLGWDVSTCIRHDHRPIEESLVNVNGDEELLRTVEESHKAQRVALNMCLLLANYGCTEAPAFPKVLATDQSLAKENSERGERAKQRVRDAMYRVSPIKEIVVRRAAPKGESAPTGKTVASHWVRGHWKMQPCGEGRTERKRIFIRPYLTHPDQVQATPAGITTYRDVR